MPGITAILHTHNDALRIARAIDSLRACDEVLVIDHGSWDDTRAVARRFGARVLAGAAENAENSTGIEEAGHDWIFAVFPAEVASEGLEAALLEWKLSTPSAATSFSILIVEEPLGEPAKRQTEVRLVHRDHARHHGRKPMPPTQALDGYLLRLRLP